MNTISNRQSKENLCRELLVVRARLGESEAFAELVRALEKTLFYYLRRLVSNEQDAWDLLQDVWMKAFHKIRSLKEPGRFRVWLYSIAHKTAMTHLRRLYKERNLIDHSLSSESIEELPETLAEYDAEKVHLALDRLELPFREVLTLYFLEDLSVDETAQIIGIPLGTVKSRLFHARKALKKILQREESL